MHGLGDANREAAEEDKAELRDRKKEASFPLFSSSPATRETKIIGQVECEEKKEESFGECDDTTERGEGRETIFPLFPCSLTICTKARREEIGTRDRIREPSSLQPSATVRA